MRVILIAPEGASDVSLGDETFPIKDGKVEVPFDLATILVQSHGFKIDKHVAEEGDLEAEAAKGGASAVEPEADVVEDETQAGAHEEPQADVEEPAVEVTAEEPAAEPTDEQQPAVEPEADVVEA